MSLDPMGELAVVEALHEVLTDLVGDSNVLELGELRIGHEMDLEVVSSSRVRIPSILAEPALPKRRFAEYLATELERRGYEIRRIP